VAALGGFYAHAPAAVYCALDYIVDLQATAQAGALAQLCVAKLVWRLALHGMHCCCDHVQLPVALRCLPYC
jgi:hypothetical protein